MKVHQIFFNNTLRNFCYLIVFDDDTIYCIDPFKASEVFNFLGDKAITAIINTHDHCDHFSGNEELLGTFKCPVFAHKNAQVTGKSHGVEDGEVIYQKREWQLQVLYTPGHTMSHICLLLKKEGIPYALFTGDCFFNAGVGNCHNGGNPEILFKTINEIFKHFPDDLLIYPGHEYLKRNLEFTMNMEKNNPDALEFLKRIESVDLNKTFFINDMKTERKINTFLRLQNSVIHQRLNLNEYEASDKAVFLKLRELRNKW